MNHPPLMEVRGLQDQGFGGLGGPSMMNYPPFERVCSVLRYEGRKVSHAKVLGPRVLRAGLSCSASSRLRRLAPAGVNPSAEQHGQTKPTATSIRQSGDTVTASPTPCPCSAARYGVRRKFRMRKSAAPRVGWVALAPRASTGPFDARCAADESRCARPSAAIDPCSTACRTVPVHKRGGGLPRLRPGHRRQV